MKLRTEIRDNRLVCQGMHVDPDNIEWFQSHHIHDSALYAHALVQAINEFRPRIGWAMWDTAIPMITERADEIMRGFGYTEEAWAQQKT